MATPLRVNAPLAILKIVAHQKHDALAHKGQQGLQSVVYLSDDVAFKRAKAQIETHPAKVAPLLAKFAYSFAHLEKSGTA